jgi:hypothetical protein
MKGSMTRVEKLYYSPKADRLFSESKELFPRYGSDQSKDATKYIVDNLVQNLPQKLKDELYKMVHAGLT